MIGKRLLTAFIMAVVLLHAQHGMAQAHDFCNVSEPFCTDNGLYEYPAGVNTGSGESGPYYDCLRTTLNPAWYYMRIMEPGDMDIYMYSTPLVDIDFCCWGPFENPIDPCPDGLTREKVVSCSYSTNCDETCQIRNAERGEYYILLITNYSNQACNIHFSKVAGNATTDNSIMAPQVSYDESICAGQDLAFYANGLADSEYHWFEVGGDWTSEEQNPVRPHATPAMSGTYGCAISHGASLSDTAYLEVVIIENYHYYVDTMDCNSMVWGDEVIEDSGNYTLTYVTSNGCDSVVELNVDLNYTPRFEIQGAHWPVGGSETHISESEYAIHLNEPRAQVDTVIWQIDCPNWYVESHGIGLTSTLHVFTYLLEPVTLHAWVINSCDTVHEEFFIQTSYFGVEEAENDADFIIVPNPTNGNVTLNFNDLQGVAEISVVNSMGQKIDAFTVNTDACREKTYQMTGMRDGLYYFIVNYKGKLLMRKVALVR